MNNVNVMQTNFAAGELSPRVYSRFTLPLYQNGLERCRNFIVELQGAARFRTGTRRVNHTRLNRVPFFLPFQFNDEQSYVLEFTEGFMRVYKDEGVIVETPSLTVTSTDTATPVKVTATAHGLNNGDEVFLNSIATAIELNGKSYLVANKNPNDFEITDIDGNNIVGDNAGTGGIAERIFELPVPYLAADMPSLKFAQNADTMTLVHPLHDIRRITRTDHDAWSIGSFVRTADPFLKATIVGITQANPAVVSTLAAHGFANGDIVAIQDVVGMEEVNGIFFKVANKTANTFEITDSAGVNIDSTGFVAYNSAGSVGAYPSAIAFFEGRLSYAGTQSRPETFWMSRASTNAGVSRYDDFTTGTDPDNAVIFTLSPSAQGVVDNIEWLAGNVEFLLCGTFAGITKITGDGLNEPITPTSVNAKRATGEGVADISPNPQGGILLYVQRGGLVVRSFEYDVLADSYISVDRNLASDHITETGIIQLAFQNSVPDAMWAVRNDGVVLGNSFKAKEDVSGWHIHHLGGTDAKALTVAVITKPNSFDQIWLGVERTINGLTKRSVEFFEDEPVIPRFEDYFTSKTNELEDRLKFNRALNEIQKQYLHVDNALTYDGSGFGGTLTPAAITGAAITFTASDAIFTASMVGRQLWKKAVKGDGFGRAEITTITDSTHVVCKIVTNFDNTDVMAAGNWYLTTDSVSGLDHLETEDVTVVTDGGKHPNVTIASGVAALDYQASVVHVGNGYTGVLKTLNIEGGGITGVGQTKPTSVSKVIVRFLDSLGAQVGSHRYKLEDIPFRSTDDLTSTAVPLFTGTKIVTFRDSTENKKHIYVSQENPMPCVIQAIDIYMEVSDE